MDGEHVTGAAEPPVGAEPTAFGWWPSRWSPAVVAAGKVSRSGLQADGGDVYWCESRPQDGGRQVVVRWSGDARPPEDVSPPGVSVRSRVHEYGGGAATVHEGVLFYIDQSDQQWYRVDEGRPVRSGVPLSSGGARPGPGGDGVGTVGWTSRYADGRVTPSGAWLVSVEERHRHGDTDHRLVAHPTGLVSPTTGGPGNASGAPAVLLVDEGDFVAAPRPSPDGRWLAWVSWDHPAMPWDRSSLWVAGLEESDGTIRLHGRRRVAGGADSSVGQPLWGRDGSLVFVDDRTGWWMPQRLAPGDVGDPGGRAVPLVGMEAEFHAPDWVLGQSTMAERSDGALVCRMHRDGSDHVVLLQPGGPDGGEDGPWTLQVIDQPCVAVVGLVVATDDDPGAGGERLQVLGSTPTESPAVWAVPWPDRGTARRVSGGPASPLPATEVSVPRPFTVSTPDGPVPGLFFAPVGPPPGAEEGPPPLVVFCHGGPTSAVDGGLDPVVQFFTGRGLAVAAVNYRGSSGFGRAYRRRLEGRWGEADVDDCVRYAAGLDEAGLVDGRRMAIRGTSSGGLTALGALIRADRFAGAATWYGVTDLEALARDTHDFESRYLDSLVGPWPEAAATYRARSPLHGVDEMSGAVLLIQGRDDPVVPADQSERFAALLEERGVSCRLILFDGESHGFRQAATIEASLTAELAFYRFLFDRPPEPAGPRPGA